MGRHKEWRKIAKKLRRKRKRTLLAKQRDEKIEREEKRRAESPSYEALLSEQRAIELFAQEEEERLREQRNREWIKKDTESHEAWLQQQQRLAEIELDKAKQEMLIQEEWEREERKKLEREEHLKKLEEERLKNQERLLNEIEEYITGEKSELPTEVIVSSETQPGKEICPFFSKTGACRFKDDCSRNHVRPGISNTLLFTGFYTHFAMSHRDEHDTDISLEYENTETYQHFREFFNDILPEFEKCGTLSDIKVCCNSESHLRGNVYVEYSSQRDALRAFRTFHGRWYAGKQIIPQFTNIPSWRSALCGLFRKGKCPKGSTCNFLHVFHNPFRVRRSTGSKYHHHNSDRNNWRWSESPERIRRSRSRDRSRERSRDRSRERSRERSRKRKMSRNDRRNNRVSSSNNGLGSESDRKRRKDRKEKKHRTSKTSKDRTRRMSDEDSD